MANFIKAYEKMLSHEGGYANNPNDRGGETYKGIARKFWLHWAGWRLVDKIKSEIVRQPRYGSPEYVKWVKHFNKTAHATPPLQYFVREFYEKNFWKANRLDEVKDQTLAEWIFDKQVNTGDDGARWTQQALGVKADGVIGPVTIAAINAADPKELLSKIKELAIEHYLEESKKPGQKQFLASWLDRVGLTEAEYKAAISRA